MSSSCSGTLLKKGRIIKTNIKKRYFELVGHHLFYYASHASAARGISAAKGSDNLAGLQAAMMGDTDASTGCVPIILVLANGSQVEYLCKGDTIEDSVVDAKRWVAALVELVPKKVKSVIQGQLSHSTDKGYSWSSRFVMLLPDEILVFATEADTKVADPYKAALQRLRLTSDFFTADAPGGSHEFAFQVCDLEGSTSYYLGAPDAQLKMFWMLAISRIIEKMMQETVRISSMNFNGASVMGANPLADALDAQQSISRRADAEKSFSELSGKQRGRLLYDFDAENDGEISVAAGETVILLELVDDDFWIAQHGRNRGFVQADYIEIIQASAPAPPRRKKKGPREARIRELAMKRERLNQKKKEEELKRKQEAENAKREEARKKKEEEERLRREQEFLEKRRKEEEARLQRERDELQRMKSEAEAKERKERIAREKAEFERKQRAEQERIRREQELIEQKRLEAKKAKEERERVERLAREKKEREERKEAARLKAEEDKLRKEEAEEVRRSSGLGSRENLGAPPAVPTKKTSKPTARRTSVTTLGKNSRVKPDVAKKSEAAAAAKAAEAAEAAKAAKPMRKSVTRPSRKSVGRGSSGKKGGGGGIKARLAMWQKKTDDYAEGQKGNVFSSSYAGGGKKLKAGDAEYGKAKAGSKTEQRAKAAKEWCLVSVIMDIGYDDPETGFKSIKFGPLFVAYQDISDTLVGILMRGKKYKRLTYKGQMLFQGMHDNVVIQIINPEKVV
eukprot:g707.t1